MLVKPRADQEATDQTLGAELNAEAVQCHLDNARAFLAAGEIALDGGAFREATHSMLVARREMESADRLLGGSPKAEAGGPAFAEASAGRAVLKPNGRIL